MSEQDGQVIIYGKKGHAEVVGLTGQTMGQAIIVTDESDLDKIDYARPAVLFSQTTKSTEGFYAMKSLIEGRFRDKGYLRVEECFESHDSICRQVANREPRMKTFSEANEVIIFVSGKKSSNGKALYSVCKAHNSNSYFIEDSSELEPGWFADKNSVGICGATSTPMWLMEEVAGSIAKIVDKAHVMA
jgi:4-hydroxy-3-methylbut-2-enyl diphosphate reductase